MIDPSSLWLNAVTLPTGAGAVVGGELGAKREEPRAQVAGAFLVSVCAPPLLALCVGTLLPGFWIGYASGGLTAALVGSLLVRFTRLKGQALSLAMGVAALIGSYAPC